MMAKRVLATVLCVLVCGVMCMGTVFAENESMQTVSKIYTLRLSETYGMIDSSPMTPAYWEYPILRAGEDYAEGTMIIKNDSRFSASMELTNVTLPYGDDAKLSYLDHLLITVSEGETVLFDNTYAHINDEEGGLSIVLNNMAPGEEHIYTIKMRCLYSYAGDPTADVSQLTWNFGANGTTTMVEQPDGLPQWAMILVITFAVTIALLVVIMIVRFVINIVKKKKKSD